MAIIKRNRYSLPIDNHAAQQRSNIKPAAAYAALQEKQNQKKVQLQLLRLKMASVKE